MAVELVPSVLASTTRQFKHRLGIARRLSRHVHIDAMDGRFVPTRSLSAKILRRYDLSGSTVHLMVKQPAAWLPIALAIGCRRVFVHLELGQALKRIIPLFERAGIEVGLAVNPSTRLTRLGPWMRSGRWVLVMSVRPGRYGGTFLPRTVDRVQEVHQHWPKARVACDGGMNDTTIPAIVGAGSTMIVVGSDVMLSRQPTVEFRRLRRLTAHR